MNSEFSLAVHALVYLNHKNTCISSEALAENICTNPARVRKVMSKLKKAGLVETREGFEGGYRFMGAPGEVNLAQVAEALDSVCVSASWRSGDQDMDCLVASGMGAVMDGIFGELNSLCAEHLKKISIESIDRRIFGGEVEMT